MIIEKILMQASKVNDYVRFAHRRLRLTELLTKGRQKFDASLSLPSGKTLESEDGILRYEYCPSREYTAKRLRETKKILSDFMQMYPIYGHLALWTFFHP
jgi:hypothetical protein